MCSRDERQSFERFRWLLFSFLLLDNGGVKTTIAAPSLALISERIAPLRNRLAAHPLYERMRQPEDIRKFMESHVFAVWDFMSLLKGLQRQLTCVELPWQPTRWPESRRFINEIVLGEESDLYQGRAISHFELYCEAMEEAGADTGTIRKFLESSSRGPELSFDKVTIPPAARRFVESTFKVIHSSRLHALAAAFTFGREDVIPDIFRSLVRDLNREQSGAFEKFLWYLERHIEVDGEDHGPLSLRMVADLCGSDEMLWEEAANAAEAALRARIALWDGIASTL